MAARGKARSTHRWQTAAALSSVAWLMAGALGGCGGTGGASFADSRGGRVGNEGDVEGALPGDAGKIEAPIVGQMQDGGQDAGNVANAEPGPPVSVPATASLFWQWPCGSEAAEMQPQASDAAATTIVGAGEFLVDGSRAVQLEIAGRLCAPDASARDVVFAIDVSDSMRDFLNLGNDPLRFGRCGRLSAVETVLKTLGAQSRVALVTFDDGVRVDSGGFWGVEEFKKQFAKADVLCARGSGTDYRVALGRVEELVESARGMAARDVYFISDGQPNAADDGVAEAMKIREHAALATMIVRGDDELLKNSLASRGMDGEPLHANVRDPEEMVEMIGKLQEARLVKAEVVVGEMRVVVDVEGREFRLERVGLPRGGVEVRVEAVDSRGTKYVGSGIIRER